MLVQLSPWETTSTTLHLSESATRRRRKRSNSEVELTVPQPPLYHDDLAFTASFVKTARRSRAENKQQQQQQHRKLLNGKHVSSRQEEDFSPVISVTTSHRVAVLGTTRAGGQSISLKESSLLHFTSRPGATTSFFQEAKTNGSSKRHTSGSLPKVSAIVDSKNNLVYSLQKENSVLVCWNSLLANGPDDIQASPARANMESPVVCMSLVSIQKGVVCGTCLDGRLFLVWWSADFDTATLSSEAWQIEYFDPAVPIDEFQHKGTVVVQHSTEPSKTTGLKRKANNSDLNDHHVSICQVFGDKNQDAILAVHQSFSFTATADSTSWDLQRTLIRSWTTTLSAAPSKTSRGSEDFLLVALANPSALALVYQARVCSNNGKSQPNHFCCAQVGLATGNLIQTPLELPATTRQAAMVSPDLLAVGTLDHILLYDLRYGALVFSESLKDIVGVDQDWMLLADSKRHRLAILYVHEGHLQFGLTTATLAGDTEEHTPLSTGISLACGLRSSLVSASGASDIVSGTRQFAKLLSPSNSSAVDHDMTSLSAVIDASLVMLKEARAEILNPNNNRAHPKFLLDVYERAVARINDHVNAKDLKSSGLDQNDSKGDSSIKAIPPKIVERTNGLNGVHNKEKKMMVASPPLKNGQYPQRQERPVYTPQMIPQRFIDGVVSFIVSILQLGKSYQGAVGFRVQLARFDARLILSRLIQSGKVSARIHFEGSASLQDDDGENFTNILRSIKLTNKRGRRVFSPVDMMHEMLRGCPDVSERLMVIMVHYALCRALPDDFAQYFLDSNQLHAQHPHKLVSRRYLSLQKQIDRAAKNNCPLDNTNEALARASSKLIIAGTLALIEHMLCYSDCNESLLQAAMMDGFKDRTEVNIVAKILTDLLKSSARRTFIQPIAQCRQSSAVLMKWISALCNSWKEDLLAPLDKGPSSIFLLQQGVTEVVKQTESVFALGDSLRQADLRASADRRERKRRRKDDESGDSTPMVDTSGVGPVAPYTIERLVF